MTDSSFPLSWVMVQEGVILRSEEEALETTRRGTSRAVESMAETFYDAGVRPSLKL